MEEIPFMTAVAIKFPQRFFFPSMHAKDLQYLVFVIARLEGLCGNKQERNRMGAILNRWQNTDEGECYKTKCIT
jgi:hypothetical protein